MEDIFLWCIKNLRRMIKINMRWTLNILEIGYLKSFLLYN